MKENNIYTPAIGDSLPAGPYRELFKFGLNIGAQIGQVIDQSIDTIFETIKQKKEGIKW